MRIVLISILSAFAVVALMMAGLGIKMLVKKHGQFKRPCSGTDPYTGEQKGCVCGRAAGTACTDKKYSPLEVNSNLMEEL